MLRVWSGWSSLSLRAGLVGVRGGVMLECNLLRCTVLSQDNTGQSNGRRRLQRSRWRAIAAESRHYKQGGLTHAEIIQNKGRSWGRKEVCDDVLESSGRRRNEGVHRCQ